MAGRRPGAFMDDEYEEDQDEVLAAMKQERMRMMMRDNGGDELDGGNDPMDNLLDFEDVQGPLSVWLKKVDVIKFIFRQFNQFLRNFKNAETGVFVYEEKIHEMC
jgi:hypothetical protein